jgi:hypothetical protein
MWYTKQQITVPVTTVKTASIKRRISETSEWRSWDKYCEDTGG